MDDEIERLVIGVRADTAGFAHDVATMKAALTQGIGSGAASAGLSIASALAKATNSGKTGFDDLKSVALKALDEIAAAALKGGGASGGGLAGLAGGLLSSVLGLPGRATGGPVAPGAAYLVGERGPELFVPTASGSIAPIARGGGGEVKVSITVAAPAGSAPQALARSGRQVARAVTQALQQAQG
jgi:phage-related minor tail protein